MNIIKNEPQLENKVEQNLPQISKRKNKKVILIFILVFIILVGFFVIYLVKKKNNDRKQDDVTQQEIEILDNLTEEEINILDEPSKQKILKDRQNICNNKLGKEKEKCLDVLKSLQVTFLENEELCEQVDSQKDQCFKNLAINKKDINLCQKVEDNDLRRFCVNFIYQYQAQNNGNVELCDKIQEDLQRESCIESVFEYIGSIEMCDSGYIINNNLVSKCKSITLLKKAVSTNNSIICRQIPLEEYREDCLRSIKND